MTQHVFFVLGKNGSKPIENIDRACVQGSSEPKTECYTLCQKCNIYTCFVQKLYAPCRVIWKPWRSRAQHAPTRGGRVHSTLLHGEVACTARSYRKGVVKKMTLRETAIRRFFNLTKKLYVVYYHKKSNVILMTAVYSCHEMGYKKYVEVYGYT